MQCVMCKQRMVPYDRNTNIKYDWELHLVVRIHLSISCWIPPDYSPFFFVFLFKPQRPCLLSLFLFPIVRQHPSACVSAASFLADLHNLWSSILYCWYIMMHGFQREKGPCGCCEQPHVTQAHAHTQTHTHADAQIDTHIHRHTYRHTHR